MKYPIRINKYLAEKNYSTRRGADLLIEKKLVKINGKIAKLGDKVEKDDKVTIAEKIKEKKYHYLAYNKPIGVSTNKDNESDPHILSATKFPMKVFPLGRLDKASHGLILLTDDGRITNRLLSPKYVHEKEYIVQTEKNISDRFIESMSGGVPIGGYRTKKCKVWRAKGKKGKNTFHIVLTEGKKHQIRRMCEHLHHKVIDLQRIRVMNIELGTLAPGTYRPLRGEELNQFLTSLKIK